MNYITECPPQDRTQLFIRKLHQCKVVFDFNDASSELKGKAVKAQTLTEMLEYITTQQGVITENIYPEVVNMVGVYVYFCSHTFSCTLISSLQRTSSVRYPHKSILQVMLLTQKKTNPSWSSHGLTCKSYMSSSFDLSNLVTSTQISLNGISTNPLC